MARVHHQEVRRACVQADAGDAQLAPGVEGNPGAEDAGGRLGAEQFVTGPKGRQARRVGGTPRGDHLQVHQVRLILTEGFEGGIGDVFEAGGEQRDAVTQIDGALLVDFTEGPERAPQQHQRQGRNGHREQRPGDLARYAHSNAINGSRPAGSRRPARPLSCRRW